MMKAAATAHDEGETSDMSALMARHQDLERQLAALDRHLALSADEQLERTRLKKEKLRVKDRILLLESRAAAPRQASRSGP
jgi:hypothetical protein